MIVSSTVLITKFGNFRVIYHRFLNGFCISLSRGDLSKPNPLVRLHSSCLFSEALHSIDCDCNLQLSTAMKQIGKEKRGVIVYLYQEGRGVGLAKKIRSMEIERTKHCDTVEAFSQLHFDLDSRNYSIAIRALKELHVNKNIRTMTNNPRKRAQMEKGGFIVSKKVTLHYPVTPRVRKYLIVKRRKLGHELGDLLETGGN